MKMLRKTWSYFFILAVCFFCSLFQLDAACSSLVVDQSNIRDLVNAYINYNFWPYNVTYPDCSIGDWDTSSVTDMSFLFAGYTDFNEPLGNWQTSNVETMEGMFLEAETFNQDIGGWDTSKVTSMASMFKSTVFNQDINDWNTSNVVNMSAMFMKNAKFNREIGSWKTSKVVDMSSMFHRARKFNREIGDFDTSKVVSMQKMFFFASVFQEDISSWKTGNVKNMGHMFARTKFNGDISSWNVSKVIDMSYMFWHNPDFNSDISSWDVSSVTDMNRIFSGASSFNQSVGKWSTKSVTSMRAMFAGASNFDQPLNSWDTSNVVLMYKMFQFSNSFNQPLDAWDTSNVQLMSSMFEGAIAFDQPLGSWNTKAVVGMKNMFQNAHSFNQPIDRWDIRNVRILSRMFYNATSLKQLFCWELDDKEYDEYLIGTNGTINKWETEDSLCSNGLNFATGDDIQVDRDLVDALIGVSTCFVFIVAIALMGLYSRKNFAERKEIPLLEVNITCLKVGFGSIIFISATYVLLTVVVPNQFTPDIIEGSIASNVDQGISFTLFEEEQLVYQFSLEEGKQYALQVSDTFVGFANLYDAGLKVVSRITDFEVNLDEYLEAIQYDAGSPVHFPVPPICRNIDTLNFSYKFISQTELLCNHSEYHYHPYKPTNVFNGTVLIGGQNQIQSSTVNVQFYKADVFGAESYKDKHYLEVKSENNLLANGELQVSEVVTIMKNQPIVDTLKHVELSNFYELDVLKNTLYEISITGIESDVTYAILLNQDGERLGQSHHYPAHFVAPDECRGIWNRCGNEYPIAPSNITNLQNKLFFQPDYTGTVILRVFIGKEFIDAFTGKTEPSRKASFFSSDEYEDTWTDMRRTPQPFTISFTEMEKATNSAVLNFKDGSNAKTLVEVNINETASINYSRIEIIEYIAIFDANFNLVASIDVSNPDDFMVEYNQIKTLVAYNQSEVTKVWLEFNCKNQNFQQVQNDFTVEILPFISNSEIIPTPPDGKTSAPPISTSGFVDPANQYASCEPDPELLTLQGTCLDGVLYYCRNDKYPKNIYLEDVNIVTVKELSGVCTCVEFICSVLPSGDADFILFLELFHLAEAIILAPVLVVSGLAAVSIFCTSKKLYKLREMSLLLFICFSFSFVQDILQYRLVQAAEFFRDIDKAYVPLAIRNTSLEGDDYLNNAAMELIKESNISEDYIRTISLAREVFYVMTNFLAILIFLKVCLEWASTAYTSVLGHQAEIRQKKFRRFRLFVRSLEFLLLCYSLYFTIKIIMDPNQYDNSLSIMEFSACWLIVAGYLLSLFLLLPKLIGMSSRAEEGSLGASKGVSMVTKSVTVTSTGIIVCLLGVAVGHYYAIIEVQNYEDLLKVRNDVTLSGVFLAQHVCQIAALGWILFDLFNKLRQFRRSSKSQSEQSKTNLFCFLSTLHFCSTRFTSTGSSQKNSSAVMQKNSSDVMHVSI